ncbi:MAG: urea carboxylase-associated family protein [Opitutaceae bacterium]|nr:urea carboxylase-associated family protein [Opitutaceae bacterium]
MTSTSPLFSRDLTHGGMWSGVISRGKRLRLTALEDGANVSVLLYNADLTSERYNMPDTLKGQHIFFLRAPYCLHSDMGRILASLVSDSVGWHDTVGGVGDATAALEKYGDGSFQKLRNDYYRNGRDCFLIELAKWGLGKRDLVPNINFFSKLVSDEDGRLSFVDGHARKGDHLELRLEMNVLVVLNTCQHPLDTDTKYHPRSVRLEVIAGDAASPAADDPSRLVRPENHRAFENNHDYFALRT